MHVLIVTTLAVIYLYVSSARLGLLAMFIFSINICGFLSSGTHSRLIRELHSFINILKSNLMLVTNALVDHRWTTLKEPLL